jgi:hypothetical protein
LEPEILKARRKLNLVVHHQALDKTYYLNYVRDRVIIELRYRLEGLKIRVFDQPVIPISKFTHIRDPLDMDKRFIKKEHLVIIGFTVCFAYFCGDATLTWILIKVSRKEVTETVHSLVQN